MQEDRQDRRWFSGFALPASLGLHLIVVALLVFGLPRVLQKPQDDQAVSVDLVPPPEAPPKPKAEPPPEAEKPQAKKPDEASPPANEAPVRQPPVSRVSPVVQFGEKDAGPRKSLDGNSAEEAARPPVPQEVPDEQTPTEQDSPPAPDKETVLSLPEVAATPTPRPAEAAKPSNAPNLKEAKTLFSRSATGDALATTAMRDLPRSVRGGTLCVTELRAQLLNASPPYFPDLLPSYQLQEGTVIDAPSAAFRAEGQWQEVGFRCEVDENATKVVSFALRIGEPIPRSEWKQRGLPSQ